MEVPPEENQMGWPDCVLTTKEAICARYAPYHTNLCIYANFGGEPWYEKGTILHHLNQSNTDDDMLLWMVQHFYLCIDVGDEDGCTALHRAVEFCFDESDVLLVRLLLAYGPSNLIDLRDNDNHTVFYYFDLQNEQPMLNARLMHTLLDYSTTLNPYSFPDDANEHNLAHEDYRLARFFFDIRDARLECKNTILAMLASKPRVFCKDVRVHIAKHIWSMRVQ